MNAIYFGKTYVGGGGDRAPDTAVGFVPLLWSNNIRARPIRLGFSERTVFDFCFRFKTRDKNVVGIVGMSRRVLHRYRRGRWCHRLRPLLVFFISRDYSASGLICCPAIYRLAGPTVAENVPPHETRRRADRPRSSVPCPVCQRWRVLLRLLPLGTRLGTVFSSVEYCAHP